MSITRFTRVFICSLVCFFGAASSSVYAEADRFYATVVVGAVDSEIAPFEVTSPSYKLGVGYQFAKEWYFESGYQLLSEENIDARDFDINEPLLEAGGLYATLLGKSAGRRSEVFFRVGLMKADVKGQYQRGVEQEFDGCEAQEHRVSLDPISGLGVCSFDNGILAGIGGVGLDFYFNAETVIRLEIEYIRGEDDYSAQAAYIGMRVNF